MNENEIKWYSEAKQHEKCDVDVKLGCTVCKGMYDYTSIYNTVKY
jgi:hypothetical protein